MRGRSHGRQIPEGHNLCVNSSAAVSMVLTAAGLAQVLAAAESAPADQAEATSAGAREERQEREERAERGGQA